MKIKTLPTLLLAGSLSMALPGMAQDAPPPPPPPDMLTYAPPSLTALEAASSTHTDFTFDRAMLQLASNLSGMDAPTREAVARLNGVTVHLLRFAGPGSYDPAAVQAIRDQFDALGWHHLVTAHARPGTQDAPPGRTDVWLDTHGVNVAGAAIVFAGVQNVDVILVSGDISTLDLLHLRGHFGIPRFPDQNLQNH